MSTESEARHREGKNIVVEENGPYLVFGDLPLVRKTQVVSEYGEPLTWQTGATLETDEAYRLCRCGASNTKPFCDDSHLRAHFDGTETAETAPTSTRQITYEDTTGIVVRRDHHFCMDAGFCGTRLANIVKLSAMTKDPQVRSLVMAMIERCPSGSLTYALREGEPDVEPNLPQQVAVATEMTSDGPIMGPLWVTGNIPVERADGQQLETRNRVALCRCGMSQRKPLCDGMHREAGIRE